MTRRCCLSRASTAEYAVYPKMIVEADIKAGRLEQVLEKFLSPPDFGVYAIYPNRNPPAKVKVFIDFVEEQLKQIEHIDRWEPFEPPLATRIVG